MWAGDTSAFPVTGSCTESGCSFSLRFGGSLYWSVGVSLFLSVYRFECRYATTSKKLLLWYHVIYHKNRLGIGNWSELLEQFESVVFRAMRRWIQSNVFHNFPLQVESKRPMFQYSPGNQPHSKDLAFSLVEVSFLLAADTVVTCCWDLPTQWSCLKFLTNCLDWKQV